MSKTSSPQNAGEARPHLISARGLISRHVIHHANDNHFPDVPTPTSVRAEARARGKFPTRPDVAATCWQLTKTYLPELALLIEPSAGDGVFLSVVEAERDIRGFDIAPDPGGHPAIIQNDFLARDIRDLLSVEDRRRPIAFIGNPPFGQRSKLAVAFLNRALGLGELVGFIVPVSFRKWSVQFRINPYAQLIADHDLPEEAFTFLGQPYSIRCCFQIWSIIDRGHQDLRIESTPATSHPDYWHGQWNRMPGAERVFDHAWDFAVRRQGYGTFEPVFSGADLDRRMQWALFKARSPEALQRLLSIDFSALAQGNAKTPGFGKADVVAAYQRRLDEEAAHSVGSSMLLQAANSNVVPEAAAA